MILRSLLIQILSDMAASMKSDQPHSEAPWWLRKAITAIHQESSTHTDLAGFIDLCGKSQEHVNRTVRRFYDCSPTELINRYRCSHAARMLRTTDLPISQIIYECGFNNVSYFNKLFRRLYEFSPRDFRRRQCNITAGKQVPFSAKTFESPS
jgi:AraC family cel operon transcriptional repressor